MINPNKKLYNSYTVSKKLIIIAFEDYNSDNEYILEVVLYGENSTTDSDNN